MIPFNPEEEVIMSIFEAIILGIIQGLTEFLPVSSSGHLVLFQNIMGLTEGALSFNIVVHFGTMFSVIFYYRRKLLDMLRHPFSRFNFLIVLTAVPAGVVGVFFSGFFRNIYTRPSALGFSFLLTTVSLVIAESISQGHRVERDLNVRDSLTVGLAQCLAIFPGVSRSGITISAGLTRGIDRELAAAFSFINSLILIAGATVLEIPELYSQGVDASIGPLIAGFVVSFLTGYVAIAAMVNILKHKSLKPFIVYVGLLSLLVLSDVYLFGIVFH